VADAMLKAAEVEILLSRTICSGKYMVLVGGDVAAVTASVEAGTTIGEGSVIDTFVIPTFILRSFRSRRDGKGDDA